MTTKGRQAVRAGLAHAAPEKLPAGTLREWHWRALTRAYAEGEDGLAENLYGRGYGGIGQRTWDRLLRYEGGRFGALTVERTVGGWGSLGERLFVTPDGIGFYRERWEEYRKRYPDVEAPFPGGSLARG